MADCERETVWERGERCSMRVCAWRLYSHASEGASWWPNAIGGGLLRWQPAEPPDDGWPARYWLAPCRRFPLEDAKTSGRCRVMSQGKW